MSYIAYDPDQTATRLCFGNVHYRGDGGGRHASPLGVGKSRIKRANSKKVDDTSITTLLAPLGSRSTLILSKLPFFSPSVILAVVIRFVK